MGATKENSMRKTLLAAALLAAMTSASAASVSVYGVMDMGVSVSKKSGATGDNRWNLQMKSGMRNSSRFGLKGVEDLGNNYKVGFILESQFAGDTGALQTSGVLWERESSLWVSGDFGKVTFGRVGYLKGVVGSTALLNSYRVNPFGSQMSNFITGFKAYTTGTSWYCNNGIVYETPDMAGLKGYLQYSNAVTDEGAKYHDKDRYAAAALRYLNGPLLLQMIADTTMRGHQETPFTGTQYRNAKSLGLQAAYDFQVVKVYGMVEGFKDSALNTVGQHLSGNGQLYDGAGATLVVQWPMGNGKMKFGGGFLKASTADGTAKAKDGDVTRYGVSAGYDYVLSKRTHLYTNYGFAQQNMEMDADHTVTRNRGMEFNAGMVHYF